MDKRMLDHGVLRLNPDGIDLFQEDPQALNQRVSAPIRLSEFGLLALHLGLIGIFIWQWRQGFGGFFDFRQYMGFARGMKDVQFYYSYWAVPFFQLLEKLPMLLAIAIWSGINLVGMWWAARVFGNKSWIVLSTYQVGYVLFYGQITGVIIGGLAGLWWGTKNQRWVVAGLALIVCLTKYHLGGPIAFILLLLSGVNFSRMVKLILWPLGAFFASWILYPGWVSEVIYRIQQIPPVQWGNISLWQWIGPLSLLVWLPPLLLKMEKQQKLIIFTSAYFLSMPYVQQTGLLALFVLPVGWVAWLGNVGFTFTFLRWEALKLLVIPPTATYLMMIWRAVAHKAHRRGIQSG